MSDVLVDAAIGTEQLVKIEQSVQVEWETSDQMVQATADSKESEVQTETKLCKEAEVQVNLLSQESQDNSSFTDHGDGDNPSKLNEEETGGEKKTLYTYKVDLSPVKQGHQKAVPKLLTTTCSSCKYQSSPDLMMAKLPCQTSPSQSSGSLNENRDSNNEEMTFKMPLAIKTVPDASKSSNKPPASIFSSTSSSYINRQLEADPLATNYYSSQSLPKVRQSLRKDVANVSKILDGDLSSPDLGIGDSDHDLNSSLRAYLTLYKYQLLRHQVNEAMVLVTGLEGFVREFSVKLISTGDYHSAISGSMSSLSNILRCTKKLCGQFTIEDSNTLFNQLESMRARKENMEKAITRQLKKTDQLLKKAKVNLKD